ncbi:hypothetical protein Glove_609g31 [Diversispora epigaea]|uniref:HMG box domain-containing protein n=1 Tax=Diversispora epigaea TaxID=1348612 RepID=A0A397G9U1_9GLOM|nr:hypothetical protein Glove_609g31 [Diversispora epigaea]
MFTSVGEIVNLHLKNGLKNSNKTMNAFMIYRRNYALHSTKLSRSDMSKEASKAWKSESIEIKNHYKRIEEDIRREFKEKTSIFFIYSNLTGTDVNTNPPMDLNSPDTIRHNYQLNMDQNSSGSTCYNPPMDQNSPDITCPGPQNTSDHTFINMDQDSLGTAEFYSSQQAYPHMEQNYHFQLPDINQGNSFRSYMDQNSPDITCPGPQNTSDHTFINMDQDSLGTAEFYSSQQAYPHMEQNYHCQLPDINQGNSFSSYMDQNSSRNTFPNLDDWLFYNSSPSNSLSTIYSRQQSVNMGQNFLYTDNLHIHMNQNPPDTDYSDHPDQNEWICL